MIRHIGRASLLGLLAGAMLLPATALAFNQAPALKAEVDAGKLPPIDQRLPADPVVLKPLSEVGTYGGQLRTDLLGGTDRGYGWLDRIIGYEPLVRWAPEGGKAVPNIAEILDGQRRQHAVHLQAAPGHEVERWAAGDRRRRGRLVRRHRLQPGSTPAAPGASSSTAASRPRSARSTTTRSNSASRSPTGCSCSSWPRATASRPSRRCTMPSSFCPNTTRMACRR